MLLILTLSRFMYISLSLAWLTLFLPINSTSYALYINTEDDRRFCRNMSYKLKGFDALYVCLLITLTHSPKAELRGAQLNGIGRMHMKGASGCRQTVMNDPGA